jgi:hypothetical protein
VTTVTAPLDTITAKQAAFISRLAQERVLAEDVRSRLQQTYMGFSKKKASDTISWLLKQPMKSGMVPDRIEAMPKRVRRLEPHEDSSFRVQRPPRQIREPAAEGVYRQDGHVYVVVASRQNPGRRYAKKIVESPPRMTERGEVVDFELVKAPGMVFALEEKDLLPRTEVEALLTKYRKCIRCGANLKQASSVARAAGKRCATKMGLI